ncbi:MAG TPA: hypothetical protein PKE27_13125 [Povalibacter sp.]|uniref:hypothetical protein n=1 Tax=Povalibacter sp. TaxID=1962978 RepID=UPI002CF50FA5|nr:hypothetical protein [Povalibacter sp.]HMN45519.1 hypothetical protein [Povalibacter sp.]
MNGLDQDGQDLAIHVVDCEYREQDGKRYRRRSFESSFAAALRAQAIMPPSSIIETSATHRHPHKGHRLDASDLAAADIDDIARRDHACFGKKRARRDDCVE